MGCNHCMSNCTPKGKHMKLHTFIDAIDFQLKYGGIFCLISGGEPTEHPYFIEMIKYANDAMHGVLGRVYSITVTTNGLWLTENVPFVKMMAKKYPNCIFQVVVDDRYYPVHVDESSKVFTYNNVLLCRDVQRIYPQGRALINNLPWEAKASKCFNIRALTKQLKTNSLVGILAILNAKGYFCTPHINIDGDILLGESALCPSASSIYKSEQEIIQSIMDFKCHACDFVNENLSDTYKALL